MATDSIIDFKYGDGSSCFSIYIRYDTHLDEFIPYLIEIMQQVDREYPIQRLNWDYFLTRVISIIAVQRGDTVRILPRVDYFNANTVIYHMTITPVPDIYSDWKNKIETTIRINVKWGGSNDLCYDGLLSEYKSEVEE